MNDPVDGIGKHARRMVELTQVRASAVPAVPKQITATQRLAALELAQRCEDYAEQHKAMPFLNLLLLNCRNMLRELAE